MDEYLRLGALHEAGHVIVAWACGWAPGPVTVNADGRGCYKPSPPPVTAKPFNADAVPFVLWPPQVRGHVEADVLIALAGDIATRLLAAPRLGGRVPDRVAERAAEIASAEVEPAGEEDLAWAAGVAAGEAPPAPDAELAAEAARAAFAGDPEGRATWLRLMEVQAEWLVSEHAARIRTFAGVLAAAGTLSAEAVAALLRRGTLAAVE